MLWLCTHAQIRTYTYIHKSSHTVMYTLLLFWLIHKAYLQYDSSWFRKCWPVLITFRKETTVFIKAWLIAWAAPSRASQPPSSSAQPLVSVSSFPLFLSRAAGRDPRHGCPSRHHQNQFHWGCHVSYPSRRHSGQSPAVCSAHFVFAFVSLHWAIL